MNSFFKKALFAGCLISSVQSANIEKLNFYQSNYSPAKVSNPKNIEYVLEKPTEIQFPKQSVIQYSQPQKISVENKSLEDPQQKNIGFQIITSYNLENNPSILAYTDLLPLNCTQLYEIQQIPDKLGLPKVTSFGEFLEDVKNLSDAQKIKLFSMISHECYKYYDEDYVCRHIASDMEKLIDETGYNSAVVFGRHCNGGHDYNIINLEDKITIVDGGRYLVADTKNVEKALTTYQKYIGDFTFVHEFFEDNQFKYRLITNDGKHFLDFIDYDISSKKTVEVLTNPKNIEQDFKLNFKTGASETSFGFSAVGISAKIGSIKGTPLSSFDRVDIVTIGYENSFVIPEIIRFIPKFNVLAGNVIDPYESPSLIGASGDIIISSDRKEGSNLSLRVINHVSSISPIHESSGLFYDLSLEKGFSWTIPLGKNKIIPYLLSKSDATCDDLKNFNYTSVLSPYSIAELKAGIFSEFNPSENFNLKLNTSLTWKKWEREFALDSKIKINNVEFNLGGYFSLSDYSFCPDKFGFNASLVASNDILGIEVKCKDDLTNYDGEIDNNFSLSFSGNLKI